jgi:hypothetical protein
MKKHDVNKLPLWARSMIEKLEADVEYYKNKFSGMGGEKETNTYFWIDNPVDGKRVFLPDGGEISFFDRYGHTVDVRVSRQGGVRVSCWGRIRTYPEASNVVRVEAVGRAEKR